MKKSSSRKMYKEESQSNYFHPPEIRSILQSTDHLGSFLASLGCSTLAVHSMVAQPVGKAQEEETAQHKGTGVCFSLFPLV